MLTPDYLKNVSDDAVKIYTKLENSIIKDIVRRLKNTNFQMTESARFQIQVAQEAGMLYDDIIEKIAKYSDISNNIIKKTFENSAIEALKFDDEIYKKHGLNPIPIKQSKTMLDLLKNTLNKTNGSLYNLTLTTANLNQQKFIEVCDEAYMEISSGAFSYTTAIDKAIKQFADGMQVEYDSGYKLNIKSAVKRAVMTGVNQTCLKMQEARANEMCCDLVEVTAHAGARPEHAEWQGKIYSRSGKNKKYPPLTESTGYGTGPGLGGWNCRHSMFPYYEGTARAYTDEELEELKPINNIKLNDNKNIFNNSQLNNNTGKSKYLNDSSKELCNKVYNKFKENKFENIGLINIDNKILGDIHTSNNKNQVSLSIKQQNLLTMQNNRSVLLIHNHPSNDTFSKNDILSLIANKKICGIIAVGNDYNYFLEINQQEFRKNIKFNEIWDEILEEVNKVTKSDTKNAHLFTNEMLHSIYVKVFQKRGWNYGRERRN